MTDLIDFLRVRSRNGVGLAAGTIPAALLLLHHTAAELLLRARARDTRSSTAPHHHAALALLATRAPLGARDLLARMLSNKRHSGAKKRFRATQRGAIKRKAAGMGHNTGLRRQHRQTRKRAQTSLVATPAILRTVRRMIGR